MKYQEFNFIVEDMDEANASQLLTIITEFVESRELSFSGGYHSTTDADYSDYFLDRITEYIEKQIERLKIWVKSVI
jgi:hypothetical protein